MIDKMKNKIKCFKCEILCQTHLLMKALEMNFEPEASTPWRYGTLIFTTACGGEYTDSTEHLDAHIEWLDESAKAAKWIKKQKTEKEKRAARKQAEEWLERHKPQVFQCKHLELDESGWTGPMASDSCEKFQTSLHRKYENDMYPRPCEECLTMRSPGNIRGNIKILKAQLEQTRRHLANMLESDYEENDETENRCQECAWKDDMWRAENHINNKFCGKWKMPVDEERGTCSKFWEGLLPKAECF